MSTLSDMFLNVPTPLIEWTPSKGDIRQKSSICIISRQELMDGWIPISNLVKIIMTSKEVSMPRHALYSKIYKSQNKISEIMDIRYEKKISLNRIPIVRILKNYE